MKRFFTPEEKQVIFLDMNRTLLDPERAFEKAFVDTLHEYTGRWETEERWTPEGVLSQYKQEMNKRRHSRAKLRPAEVDQLRQTALSAAFSILQIPVGGSFAKSFLQKVREKQEQQPQVYPDVRETLEQLGKSYRLAVISNGSRERQEKYLRLLGLDILIPPDRLFTYQKGGVRKPHPEIFETALREVGITAEQGVMVGNSWKNDVLGAAGVGMDAVWIHPAHAKKSSQRRLGSVRVVVIRRFYQLDQLFEAVSEPTD